MFPLLDPFWHPKFEHFFKKIFLRLNRCLLITCKLPKNGFILIQQCFSASFLPKKGSCAVSSSPHLTDASPAFAYLSSSSFASANLPTGGAVPIHPLTHPCIAFSFLIEEICVATQFPLPFFENIQFQLCL